MRRFLAVGLLLVARLVHRNVDALAEVHPGLV